MSGDKRRRPEPAPAPDLRELAIPGRPCPVCARVVPSPPHHKVHVLVVGEGHGSAKLACGGSSTTPLVELERDLPLVRMPAMPLGWQELAFEVARVTELERVLLELKDSPINGVPGWAGVFDVCGGCFYNVERAHGRLKVRIAARIEREANAKTQTERRPLLPRKGEISPAPTVSRAVDPRQTAADLRWSTVAGAAIDKARAAKPALGKPGKAKAKAKR